MLHIHCGDCSADALRTASVQGEVAVWTDMLYDGPAPATVGRDGWNRMRAGWIARRTGGGVGRESCRKRFDRMDAAFDRCTDHDELVLWFDACLFDQTILVRHLDRLSRLRTGGTRLSLICIGEHPNVPGFRGLGELRGDALAALLPDRTPITPAQLDLGRRAWAAWRSPDPRAVEDLLADDTSALPFLADALRRRLEEFPWMRDGLSRLQREALSALASGPAALPGMFVRMSDAEERPFCGDTAFFAVCADLAECDEPLLHVDGPGPIPRWETPQRFDAWRCALSEPGRRVLDGEADHVDRNGADAWLGGVRLRAPDRVFRWDADAKRLRPPGN